MPLELTPQTMPYYNTATTAGIKQYIIRGNQTGTDIPTSLYVTKNTLGETPTWSKIGLGDYHLNTIADTFNPEKTIIQATMGADGGIPRIIAAGSENDPNYIALKSWDAAGSATDINSDFYLTITIIP